MSVFGYKALGRGTDAGRVFTFWGRAREAVQAAQGVQPLVRNEVTQNSPDIQTSGLSASQSAHTGLAPV